MDSSGINAGNRPEGARDRLPAWLALTHEKQAPRIESSPRIESLGHKVILEELPQAA